MEQDLWQALTEAEKNAWKELEATLESPGFRLIRQDITEVAEGLEQLIYNCQSWDQYQRTMGALEALQLLLNVETRALNVLQQAVAERLQNEPEAEVSTNAFV